MFSKKSLFIVATALLATISQAAPVDGQVVTQLKQATPEDINALALALSNGINGVIHLSQQSNKDETPVLKDYVDSMSDTTDTIKKATGSIPPQLDGAFNSLKSYVKSYKAPIKARDYNPTDVNTHQTGPIGTSEGTQMVAPLANDINGLLQSNSAAGQIYKQFDAQDQQTDAAVNALGNFLAPVTLGGSKAISNYLTGPAVQSLTHGTYDAIAHMVGTPVDRANGVSELSPADQAMANQAQANQAQPQGQARGQVLGQAKQVQNAGFRQHQS